MSHARARAHTHTHTHTHTHAASQNTPSGMWRLAGQSIPEVVTVQLKGEENNSITPSKTHVKE